MARLKFRQLSIEVVLLARRWLLRHYHNFAILADLDASDMHTGCSDGPDRSCHVSLAKCG